MRKFCFLIVVSSFLYCFILPQFSYSRVGESLGKNLGSGTDYEAGERIDNYAIDRQRDLEQQKGCISGSHRCHPGQLGWEEEKDGY